MTTLTLHAIIDETGRLKLDVATGLPAGDVEIEVILRPAPPAGPPGVDRAPEAAWRALVGKLEWTGDAIAEQRRLRDDWPATRRRPYSSR